MNRILMIAAGAGLLSACARRPLHTTPPPSSVVEVIPAVAPARPAETATTEPATAPTAVPPAVKPVARVVHGKAVGKSGAPVTVSAQVTDASAHVTVRFDAPATAVQFDIRGIDGLKVTGVQPPPKAAAFNDSEVSVFEVGFARPRGASQLLVGVKGLFNGVRLHRQTTFAVGEDEPATAASEAAGALRSAEGGERVKMLPAQDGPGAGAHK